MSNTEIPVQLFEKILFGELRPIILQEKYEQEGIGPFEAFWDMPDHLNTYLRLRESFTEDNPSLSDLPEQFPSLFFVPTAIFNKDIHPLGRFYDNLVKSESILLLQELMEWRDTLPLMMLSYKMIEVQNILIEFLKELAHRRTVNSIMSDPLQAYVVNTLFAALMVLLKDLQLRFGHLMDGRVVSDDKLNVLHLKRPVPDTAEHLLTEEGAVFLVQHTNPDQRTELFSKYINRTRALPENSSYSLKNTKEEVLNILENALLVHWIIIKCAHEIELSGREPDENNEFLENLYMAIETGEHSKSLVDSIIEGLNELKQLFHFNEGVVGSKASQLLIELHELLHNEVKPGNLNENKRTNKIFSKYINRKDIRDELDISQVTLNKYLNKAGIKAIKFSQKEVYIHKDDYEKFKQFYISQVK